MLRFPLVVLMLVVTGTASLAQEPRTPPAAVEKASGENASSESQPSFAPIKPDPSAKQPVPLNKEASVLFDAKRKVLIVNSEVVLREGMLEMLLCKKYTKEHESILAFDGKAYIVHAGLVALGIDPGKPVVFNPEYQPPAGPRLKIDLVWKDADGKEHRADARQWIRYSIHRYFGEPMDRLPDGVTLPDDGELRFDATNKELSWYGPMSVEARDRALALSEDESFQKAIRSFFEKSQSRPMDVDWVFAGSQFARNETDGHRIYLAESGDVICVANFPSAMIDVASRSSAEGQESLLFEAWTERIPPVGTAVRIEISRVLKEPAERKEKNVRTGPASQDETRTGDAPERKPR